MYLNITLNDWEDSSQADTWWHHAPCHQLMLNVIVNVNLLYDRHACWPAIMYYAAKQLHLQHS